MRLYHGVVLGETVEFREDEGSWQWRRGPAGRNGHVFATASEAALEARAVLASDGPPSREELLDVLCGIAESAVVHSAEEGRLADVLRRAGERATGGLAGLQREVLRLSGMAHDAGVLMERRRFGDEGPADLLLVEIRPGTLPPFEVWESRFRGRCLSYSEAPVAPSLEGSALYEVSRQDDACWIVPVLADGTRLPRFGGTAFSGLTASLEAVRHARQAGAAHVVLRGIGHPGAAEYARVHGMTLDLDHAGDEALRRRAVEAPQDGPDTEDAEEPDADPAEEARRDAWSDFEGDFLTDGKGNAPAATWRACQAAFDAAWPDREAARAAAEAEHARRHPAPSRRDGRGS